LQVFHHGTVQHVQLEVRDAHAGALVVLDVLGPGTALDVQQLTQVEILEL